MADASRRNNSIVAERIEQGVPSQTESTSGMRDAVLFSCRVLNIVTAISLLCCALSLGAGAVVSAGTATERGITFFCSQVVRIYAIVLCCLCILVETEYRFILSRVPLMDMWIVRSLVYGFLASLTFKNAVPQHGIDGPLAVFRSVSTVMLLFVSSVYLVGGLFCLGFIRRLRRNREDELRDAETEIEELEDKKRELQRLLGRPAAS